MPDQLKDGGQELANEALPKPEFEEVSDDQQHSEAAKTGAQFDESAFLAKVEQIVKREVQSTKDQRIDKLYKQLGSDPRQIVEAIKAGQDPDKVLESLERQSVFDRLDRVESVIASPQKPSPNGRTEADEAFDKAVGLVTEAGLANDPEVQELFKTFKGKPDDFVIEVGRKVIARNTQKAPAAASATSPAGGGGASVTLDSATDKVNELTAQYAKASAPSQRAELKTKLAEARAELEKLEAQG